MAGKRIERDILTRALMIVETCMRFNATWNQCVSILRRQDIRISQSTIEKAIQKKYKCTFEELRQRRMADVKLQLRQKAVQMALDGHPTMLIFCLKNLDGWTDSIKTENVNHDIIHQVKVGENGAIISETIEVDPVKREETIKMLSEVAKQNYREGQDE